MEIIHKYIYIYDSLFVLLRKLTQIISVPRRKYSAGERKYILLILIVRNLNINFTSQMTDNMSIFVSICRRTRMMNHSTIMTTKQYFIRTEQKV